MLVDLKAGRRLELPWLTGKVVELGRAYGVPTPPARRCIGCCRSKNYGVGFKDPPPIAVTSCN